MRKLVLLGLLVGTFANLGCGSDGAAGVAGPAGAQGAPGSKGDTGTTPEAAAGAIVPNVGILDRELDVVVTVDNTKLDAQSAFDFGAGVTVSNPTIVSPTTAFVHLKVDKGAATGARDVKITAAGKQLTATKGFTVGGAVAVSVLEGTPEQGAYVLVDIQNRDHSAFSSTGLKIESDKLALDTPGPVTATNALAYLIIDPLAPAGDTTLTLTNQDATGKPLRTFISEASTLKTTARTPTALTVGTAKTGELISKDLETKLYKYTTTGAGIVTVTYSPGASTTLEPFMYMYPKSGKFADMLFGRASNGVGEDAVGVYPVSENDEGYVVATDYNFKGGAAAGFGFSIVVNKLDVAAVTAESSTAHATAAAAQTVAALPAVITGTVSTASEVDVYKITVAANDNVEISYHREAGISVQLMQATGGTPTLAPATSQFDPVLSSNGTSFAGSGRAEGLAVGSWYIVVTGQTGKKPTGKYTLGVRKVT